MLEQSYNPYKRLEEYFTYLSSNFNNTYAAHDQYTEEMARLIEDYCLRVRERVNSIAYEEEDIQLTGRLAEYLGLYDQTYDSEFSSVVWRNYLIWIRDLLNLGPSKTRTEQTFFDLFNSRLDIIDNTDFNAPYDETKEGFSNVLNIDFFFDTEDFDQDNFISIFAAYKDLLPTYLYHNVRLIPILEDVITFTESIDTELTFDFFDFLTVDFLKTGDSFINVLDKGGFDASAGNVNFIPSIKEGDFYKVIVPGTVGPYTLNEGDYLVAETDKMSGVTIEDFDIRGVTVAIDKPISEPILHEVMSLLNFSYDSITTVGNEPQRISDTLSIDPSSLPSPVDLTTRSYVNKMVASDFSNNHDYSASVAGLTIHGNVLFYDVHP